MLMIPSRFAVGCMAKHLECNVCGYAGRETSWLVSQYPKNTVCPKCKKSNHTEKREGWILRNDIIWAKTNPMPESVKDRFSKKHEHIFFFTKNTKYYFDLDAVREGWKPESVERLSRGNSGKRWENGESYSQPINNPRVRSKLANEPKGKNPGDVWLLPTANGNEKHFAVYADKLVTIPIASGCPNGGVVLDPFAGTGTTIDVAIRLGRRAIGIEGNKDYYKIMEKRVREESLLPMFDF